MSTMNIPIMFSMIPSFFPVGAGIMAQINEVFNHLFYAWLLNP